MCDFFFFFERHVITLIVEGLKRNISNNFAGCNFHHYFFFENIIIIVKIYFMIFSKNIYIFLIKFPSTLQKKNFPFLRISLPWQLLAALSIGSQISSFPFCIWTTHWLFSPVSLDKSFGFHCAAVERYFTDPWSSFAYFFFKNRKFVFVFIYVLNFILFSTFNVSCSVFLFIGS